MQREILSRILSAFSSSLSWLSLRTFNGALALMFSCFMVGQAQAALSQACQDINTQYSTTQVYAPPSGQRLTNGGVTFSPFSIGEKITATASSTGTTNNTNSSTINIYADDGNILILDKDNKTSNGGNFNASNSYTFNGTEGSRDIYLLRDADNQAGQGNTLTLRVTCTDSSAASTDATLSTLSLSSGSLTPSFTSATTSYTASVANGVTSITVTPTVNDSGATVKVNGTTVTSGSASSNIALNVGAKTITVTVTAADGTTTKSYSIVVTRADQVPVANNATATVAANSSANAITLNITGGTAASVAVATQASHGTATVSGTSITYTPTAGYSGSDSFTYTATNTSGTSSPATVSITVSPPAAGLTVSPAAGALTAGTVGTAYSKTVTVSGGTAPYDYQFISGSLPAGISINSGSTSSKVISGTPTAAGTSIFTVKVTDANNVIANVTYSITIAQSATTLAFSSAAGSLTDAMAGEKYNQQIAVSGGASPLTFSILSGNLPNGLTLSPSGELSGTLAANTQNDYTFTVKVTDANGANATASYRLKVKERAVTVPNQVVNVPSGSTPPDTRLDKTATGGPFNNGQLVSVQPPNAGTATLTMGDYAQAAPVAPVGWYLKFTPTTGYSGSVVITFSLTSGIGSSTGTVTYNLNYDPAKVATQIDGEVRDFVQSRQSLISSTIKVPGLLERRNVENAREPVTTRVSPSSNGMTLGFSTSLAQMEAAQNNANRAPGEELGGIASSPFNIWLNGTVMLHNRPANDSKWGSFGMLSAGVDYLITDKALVGMSFHMDRMTDPTADDAKLTGNGWLAGPYTSLEIGKGVFWDTSLLYGGSANDIDTQFWNGKFDTRRWMADTAIKGQWYLDSTTVLTPKLRAVYFSEQVKDYTVSNAKGDTLTLDGFTSDQLRVSLGGEIAREYTLSNNTKLTPKVGLTGGFSGIDGSGAFGSLSAGLSVETANEWNLDFNLLFNVEGDGDKSAGAQARVSKRF
ncbi:cadherin-like beta sandwich domain-containing protein [Rhizobium oryzicola]|uniref:Cadherin-like beta sandwich domain-containing protein n=1 Tax=Rhizobium oryzicola TaxID=1232668 RepID=A0ABT8SZN3_9HYPH|nr:cadherin-like beta sandwich domain-containing protein [Rhizobium oryzicola]MDO1583358.1 cadherin-like beta sandwich domain-containing protein [Rhizobium oryzicola]